MKILIADDDRVSTLMLGRTLEKWGFGVDVVHDGTSAWERIGGSEPPQLVIADWMMPGLDGIELCQRIRAAELKSPIDVILLTARSSQQRARIHVGQRTRWRATFPNTRARSSHTASAPRATKRRSRNTNDSLGHFLARACFCFSTMAPTSASIFFAS